MANLSICVIGAGVVGLSTALQLQKEYPTANVTIIADKFNRDTTSDGAAGIFEPTSNFSGPNIGITRQWIKDSFAHYKTLMNSEKSCCINTISGYNLSNESQAVTENHYIKLVATDYRTATQEEVEQFQGHVKYATFFSTLIIPCRKLLPFYIKKIRENGAKIQERTVTSFEELKSEYNIIFNCTGLGAKYLCDDIDLVPIRGQIVQVQAPWVKNFYIFEFINYIIPCGYDGSVTLGGTQDYGSFQRTVDEYTSNSIRNRCEKLLPNLKTAPVIRNWVGLRPYRHKVRVDSEKFDDFMVIHNYGHGGSGVTSAPGTAKYAVKLFHTNFCASGKSHL